MKTIINGNLTEYKNAIKKMGREIDNLIEFTIDNDTTILGNEEINSVSPHYNGDLLKSVMKQLDINSNIDIPIGTEVNYKFGVKVRNDEVEDYTDNFDYINFGNYIVYSSEKLEDTNSYQLVCYDKMLYAMKDYDTPKLNGTTITYPITIKNYLIALCDTLGLTFANGGSSDRFVNQTYTLWEEMYLDNEDKSLNYLYRDVLDDLAEITASTICINENDELELRYVNGGYHKYYKYRPLEYITGSSSISFDNKVDRIIFSFDEVPTNTFNFITDGQTFTLSYRNGNAFRLDYRTGSQTTYQTQKYRLNQETKYRINLIYNRISTNIFSITIRIYNYSTQETTTLFSVNSVQILNSMSVFGNDNSINLYQIVENDISSSTYYPYYDKDTLEIGLITENSLTRSSLPMIVLDGYTGNITPQPENIEEIDKDFLKEDGAGFGELFGPINTITLSRTDDDNSITISIPYDLPEEDRKELILVDNTSKEASAKRYRLKEILESLYGLYYTKNNYKSTGLGYLDLLDRYNVVIDDKTYPCIMLNDDFQVEAGLEEYIFAGEMTNSKNTYIDSDRSVRINDRTSYRLDKLEEKTKTISTYSTSETEIGTWKGAKLYRRIFEGNLNSSGTLDNDISVDGTIQRIEGYVYSIYANWWKIGSHYFPEPQYDSCFTIPQSSASFNIETNGHFNQNSKYVVIVEYTK